MSFFNERNKLIKEDVIFSGLHEVINYDEYDKKIHNFNILNKHQVQKLRETIIEECSEMSAVPITVIPLLLNVSNIRWDKERFLDNFFKDMENPVEDLYEKAQLPSSEGELKIFSCAEEKECLICMDTEPLQKYPCGHSFCNNCWILYIREKIYNQGFSHSISCPECPKLLDEGSVNSFIKDSCVRERYQDLLLEYFIHTYDGVRRCAADDCFNILQILSAEFEPVVMCSCGVGSCCLCPLEWHAPIKCSVLEKWLTKCVDDSETNNWMAVNTKNCPKCKVSIEKNGGCNHILCLNKSCRFEFCWLCLTDWKAHTGVAYSCNIFKEEAGLNETRINLKRFQHYSTRFGNHKLSSKLEKNLFDNMQNHMKVLQEKSNVSWVEVQFLQQAVDVLCQSRRCLMNTYAFAFYLAADGNAEIFEANQRDLEASTEILSGYLENELPVVDITNIKCKIIDVTVYCRQRRLNLIKHVYEGYNKNFWKYRDS